MKSIAITRIQHQQFFSGPRCYCLVTLFRTESIAGKQRLECKKKGAKIKRQMWKDIGELGYDEGIRLMKARFDELENEYFGPRYLPGREVCVVVTNEPI